MSQFANKTAVISGGAEGIGLSIAQAVAAEGMNVVIADIDQERLAAAEQQLQESGAKVLALPLDVASEEQWQGVADKAMQTFGGVHMLVNNAGVGGDVGIIEKADSKGWQWTLDVNLMGVVYGAKAVVPKIKETGEGGWVINVASMAGMGGVPYGGSYTATKSAVVALSESWAVELKSAKVQVSVLCPAFVQTRIHESYRNRQDCYKSETKAPTDPAGPGFASAAKQAVENGIPVEVVGKRVIEAISQGELYIFTHPNYRPVTQYRAKAIDDAFERAAKSPLLQDYVDLPIDDFQK